MAIFNLPDDIFLNKAELDSPIVIHRYTATKSQLREKAILHRNCVSLVISGQKTMQFAEASVDTNDKEIHLLSSGNTISSFEIGTQNEFESILIFFDDKMLADFSIMNTALIDEELKKHQSISSRYISFQKDDFIRNYIQSLQLMVTGRKPFSAEMKRLKLWELLLYLLENHSRLLLGFLNRGSTLHNELAIRKVVEGNVMENLSLDEMAFLCNVSASTFKRLFRKIYKTSPATWFAEQKMKMAADLLTKHKARPSEIWFKLGYKTHTSFTKSFKKHYGVAPTIYAEA